jgi:hypothetical protein
MRFADRIGMHTTPMSVPNTRSGAAPIRRASPLPEVGRTARTADVLRTWTAISATFRTPAPTSRPYLSSQRRPDSAHRRSRRVAAVQARLPPTARSPVRRAEPLDSSTTRRSAETSPGDAGPVGIHQTVRHGPSRRTCPAGLRRAQCVMGNPADLLLQGTATGRWLWPHSSGRSTPDSNRDGCGYLPR